MILKSMFYKNASFVHTYIITYITLHYYIKFLINTEMKSDTYIKNHKYLSKMKSKKGPI